MKQISGVPSVVITQFCTIQYNQETSLRRYQGKNESHFRFHKSRRKVRDTLEERVGHRETGVECVSEVRPV